MLRRKIWEKNFEYVAEHNDKNLSYKMELNAFADMVTLKFIYVYSKLFVNS